MSARGAHDHRSSTATERPLHWSGSLLAALIGLAVLAAACGQVVTLTPTPTPQPTPTVDLSLVVAVPEATQPPAAATPAPTAPPTETPTPRIHVVQRGESLLAIAEQYGVSPALLQDANGILDPRTLQIGQQLVVPAGETASAPAVTTVTPTPLPVEIRGVTLTETASGGLLAQGEALNRSGTLLEQVRIGLVVLDAAGEELGAAESLTALDLVRVDEPAPFAVLLPEMPADFERFRVVALGAVPAYPGSYYRDLEIRRLQSAGEGQASHVVGGVIFNAGTEEVVQAQVIVTAYDALDRVIAVRKASPQSDIVPRGGETPFSVHLAPVGGPVARVAVAAEARRASALLPRSD